MADTPLRTQSTYPEILTRRSTDWGAIWGGVFIFAAIWTVFEALALAIFAGSNIGAGIAIWTIVLTIIAMYVAGRSTAQLAGVTTRTNGLIHGMMMFGLSVVSVLVLAILARVGFATTVGIYSGHAMSVGAEWTTFIALLLGWLAAMGGASTGAKLDTVESRQP